MSLFEFKLPDIGEGVMEGEIVAWHVEPGQSVREDDPMVEVMTDKATVTIGAPKTGTVNELRANVGDVVPVGSVIVTLDTNGATRKHVAPPPPEAAPAAPRPKAPEPQAPRAHAAPTDEGPSATAVGDIKETLPGTSFIERPAGENHASAGAKPLATPATRKLARDLGVDLARVEGSGSGGRITKEDVEGFASRRARSTVAAPIRVVSDAQRAPSPADGSLEDRKPFIGIRRRIAERMQTAKNTAAHFTFVEECDVGRLLEVRDRLRPVAQERGLKLTFLPFIVKAVVAALKKHPVLNIALDEAKNEIVYKRYYHIGIATATDQGLLVPVVRDADKRSIVEVGLEIERLSQQARDGKISPQDLSGSTFTITSLGRFGGLFATPILNLPEVGILGVHQIKERPVVKDGAIAIGNVMLLSLSFDHRLVDGHIGAAFAYEVIAYLEEPERLMLDMA
jgi:pyruvate dehydrogenase E2 component (dihydrolipoamide acetyltransferase)